MKAELRPKEPPPEAWQMPLSLRNLFVFPPPAGLHHTNAVAFFRGTKSGNTPTESRTDDRDVVVEGRHNASFLAYEADEPMFTCEINFASYLRCVMGEDKVAISGRFVAGEAGFVQRFVARLAILKVTEPPAAGRGVLF